MSVGLDPGDARIAIGAQGLLRTFNEAGVLDVADVHVAARVCDLAREDDEQVRLAFALAVRALRTGSVCIDLAAAADTVLGEGEELLDVRGLPWPEPGAWLAAVRASALTAEGEGGGGTPGGYALRLVNGLLYLERYWRQEELVRAELRARAGSEPPEVDLDRLAAGLDRLFRDREGTAPSSSPDRQRLAAAVAALRRVCVVAGGPGTGKTTTVARLLALLRDQPGRPLRIALAAPTGKAAARLGEAVRETPLPDEDRARVGDPGASTLHRLLGRKPGSSRFRYDRHNRLPLDVVIVDETSMVSLTLMACLLDALPATARLILVGDPDQLASVEAGAVLGDVVRATGAPEPELQQRIEGLLDGRLRADLNEEPVVNGVVTLTLVHRYRPEEPLDRLAQAVRRGDADAAVRELRAAGGDPAAQLVLVEADPAAAAEGELGPLRRDVLDAARELAAAGREGDTLAAVAGLERHRLLCAHRDGPYGVHRWTRRIESWLTEGGVTGPDREGGWYPGQPLLITANDYETGLFNGDSGVVVLEPDGQLRAAFPRGAGAPYVVAPARLAAVQPMHAMTVHRAQGSQFGTVSLVLPPPESPLLTRELFYTAITRARERVRIVGTEEAVRAAVARPIARASGLRDRLST